MSDEFDKVALGDLDLTKTLGELLSEVGLPLPKPYVVKEKVEKP